MKKLPILLQSELSECGLTCLTMIANYHGHQIDLNSMRSRFPISLDGAHIGKVLGIAGSLNFVARAIKSDIPSLEKLKTPAILHWNMNHFVVLKSHSSTKTIIHDPARGEVEIPKDELNSAFTGVAVELEPAPTFSPKAEKRNVRIRDIIFNIADINKDLGILFVMSILLLIFSLGSPLLLQLVVDNVLTTGSRSILLRISFGFFGLLLCHYLVSTARSYLSLSLTRKINYSMTSGLFYHLLRLPFSFFERRHTADVISRFQSIMPIQSFLTEGALLVVVDGIITLASLALMIIYSGKLASVVVVGCIFYLVIRSLHLKKQRELQSQAIQRGAEENATFLETLKAMQAIKLYGQESSRHSLWTNQYHKALDKKLHMAKLDMLYQNTCKFILGIENLLVIALGAILVLDEYLSIGMFLAFVAYKGQFSDRTAQLVDKFIEFSMLDVHLDRLGGIIHTDLDPIYSRPAKLRHAVKGKIEVKDLWFRYDESQPYILQAINLTIEPGESIAITGASGRGKTTLLKIMMGILTPTKGQVLLDSKDIHREVGVGGIREHIAAVMQDDSLLSGSIGDNISLFEADASLNKLEAAAKSACILNTIKSKPMTFHTNVGDMGNTLSGGQKQRVLLARALYRDPKILFLDEATSHLDLKVESEINNIVRAMKITRITIAHRQNTIDSADRIFKL